MNHGDTDSSKIERLGTEVKAGPGSHDPHTTKLIDSAASVSIKCFSESSGCPRQIYPGSVTEMALMAGQNLRLISVISPPPLLLLYLCFVTQSTPTPHKVLVHHVQREANRKLKRKW